MAEDKGQTKESTKTAESKTSAKQDQEATEAQRDTKKGVPSDEEVREAEQVLMAPNAKPEKQNEAREVLARARGSGIRANQGMQTTETHPTAFRGVSPAGAAGTQAAQQATDEVATQRVKGAPSEGADPETETERK